MLTEKVSRGEKGVTAGFSKAKNKQGCSCIVIDLDMHLHEKRINFSEIAKRIFWRESDFSDGSIKECYIIYHDKAVKIDSSFSDKKSILEDLKKLEP